MTDPKRHFVGWERPFVEAAADHLIAGAGGARAPDLSDTVVVLPGSRAVRLLEARLAGTCTGAWRPPRIVTEGGLPGALRSAAPPAAARSVRALLWAEALRSLAPGDRARLPGRPPRERDLRGWLRVGARLDSVVAALAAEGLGPADVASVAADRRERWDVLRAVSERVAERLDTLGLLDPARAAQAARDAPDLTRGARVLLAGLAEVPAATRALLEACDGEVEVAVFAGRDRADGFDAWGAVDAGWWNERGPDVPDDAVAFVDGPAAVAQDLAAWLAALPGGTGLGEVTLGLLDEDLAPALRAELFAHGLELHLGAGRAASSGPLARLLAASVALLRQRRFEDLAALARHPWLARRGRADEPDAASRLDRYAREHLPYRLGDGHLARGSEALEAAAAVPLDWIAPLSGEGALPLPRWCARIREVFGALPDEAAEELAVLDRALEGLEAVTSDAPLQGDAALELVLSALGDQRLPAPTGPASLETLGWLELPLDTSPHLYVAGVTSSRLPEPLPREALLPDALRAELGLPTAASRTARDAYWLRSLCATRPGLRLVAGRRSSRGDPQRPSRLLTRCDPDTLTRRVRSFFVAPDGATRRRAETGSPGPSWSPRIPPLPTAEALHVSAVDAYLDSPFQYALRYGLGLDTVPDAPRELDGRAFGDLVHEVLEDFGSGPDRHSPDEARILASVTEALERRVRARFDEGVQPAVPLQLEELRARLAAFAREQARLVQDGWLIAGVERTFRGYELDVDGAPVLLHGRVDRIDHRERDDAWRVIDYKTGEGGDKARTAHGPISSGPRKGRWRKLQLVLYRELFLREHPGAELEVGYFLLPKNAEDTRFDGARWSADELGSGLDEAREVRARNPRRRVRGPRGAGPARADPRRPGRLRRPGRARRRGGLRRGGVAVSGRMVLASAGTGKTFTLTSEYLRLMARGVAPERIVAATFTRKAAGEILGRVVERLVRAEASEAICAREAERLGLADFTRDRARELLVRLGGDLDALRISTLDSFQSQLARASADAIALPAEWEPLDEGADEELRLEVLARWVARWGRDDLLELLRDLRAGDSSRSVFPTLLANLTEGLRYARAAGPGAWECVAVPPRPSDAELAAALRSLAAAELPQKKTGGDNGHFVKARAQVQELAGTQRWSELLEKGLGRCALLGEETYYGIAIPEPVLEACRTLAAESSWRLARQTAARNAAAARLHAEYEAELAEVREERAVASHDDVARALADAADGGDPLAGGPPAPLYERLDERIDHLLLDEFQDTSPVQWRVLRPLAEQLAADRTEGPGARSLLCVGDPKQSIYAWREAEPELVEFVRRDLDLDAQPLVRNYRSSAVVLDAVNRLFEGLHSNAALGDDELLRSVAARFAETFAHHEAAGDLPGAVLMREAPLRGGDADAACLEVAVSRARYLHDTAPGADVAILLRRRKQVPRLLRMLQDADVPAAPAGGNPLVDAHSVNVALAALHLADHPDDTAAAFHVGSSPLGAPLGLDWPHDEAARRRASDRWRAELVVEGYGAFLERLTPAVAAAFDGWERSRYSQLVEAAHRHEAAASLRPGEFVRRVRTERVDTGLQAPVQVLTVHGSKGLEFDAVLLPELHASFEPRSPHFLARRPPGEPLARYTDVSRALKKELRPAVPPLEELAAATREPKLREELCGLYVALTRAVSYMEWIVPEEGGGASEDERKPGAARAATAARVLRAAFAPDGEPDGENPTVRRARLGPRLPREPRAPGDAVGGAGPGPCARAARGARRRGRGARAETRSATRLRPRGAPFRARRARRARARGVGGRAAAGRGARRLGRGDRGRAAGRRARRSAGAARAGRVGGARRARARRGRSAARRRPGRPRAVARARVPGSGGRRGSPARRVRPAGRGALGRRLRRRRGARLQDRRRGRGRGSRGARRASPRAARGLPRCGGAPARAGARGGPDAPRLPADGRGARRRARGRPGPRLIAPGNLPTRPGPDA